MTEQKDVIEFTVRDQTAIVRLNRPEVHNSVDKAVMGQLESILDRIEEDSGIRTLILTGTGNQSFCAGGDLDYFASLKTREEGLHLSMRMQAIFDRIWNGDKVSIAAVNGQALGGGCEILTACHFRIASEHASFSYRQAQNGIITGWGGGVRLFRQLGRSQALRLLLTSESIDAPEALRISLVDRVVPPDKLMDTCLEFAAKIRQSSPAAVSAFLRLARALDSRDFDHARTVETETFADLWVGEDFRNFLERFSEK